jgi:hypothetical protein
MMDYGVRARCVSLQYRRGKGWIIATATGPPRASELVYGVEEVVAKLDAEVRALWRVQDVSVRAHRVPGMVLGVSGRAACGQCRALLRLGLVRACSGECGRAC